MMRRLVFLFIVICLLLRIAHAQGAGIFSAWPEGVIDVREYSSVNAAIAAIGSTSRALLIASAQTINSNLTVPSNVQLWFTNGGLLTINTGVTLTVNGSVSAPAAQQIFGNVGGPDSALGLVNFGNSSVPFVTPQWFGAKQDNATDDHRALTAALYAGQVAEVGTVDDLLAHPHHPYTSALLKCSPNVAVRVNPLPMVPGASPDSLQALPGCRFEPRCPRALARCAVEAPGLSGNDQRAACWNPLT